MGANHDSCRKDLDAVAMKQSADTAVVGPQVQQIGHALKCLEAMRAVRRRQQKHRENSIDHGRTEACL
eukprot:10601711-Prorocentrum_lima.AAC.1